MKKYSWILALLAALTLAFAFTACGGDDENDGDDDGDLEWKVVFDMQDASKGTVTHKIQELTAGDALSFTKDDNSIAPLVKAGEIPLHVTSFDAVDVDGKIALKYVTVATWGPGFDLPNSVFGFREGDKITVIGKAEGAAIDLALNRNQGSDQQIVGERITAEGDFTIEATLEAADVAKIGSNEQKVIRFEDRKGATTVTITQIKIEGNRPSNIKTLDAPVIALSGSTISWDEVKGAGGYKVLADGTTDVASLLADATSYNLARSDLDPGDYSITVVALGVAGSTKDSEPSNAVAFTKVAEVLVPKITITADSDFDYAPGDGPANPGGVSLKGNIKAAISAQINSYAGGQVWLYWVYVGDSADGRGNSYGIGSFGGESYSTPATGPTLEGIAKIDIPSAGFALGGDGNDAIVLNPYNACAVIKVEVYE
jgi:hypothetical protein